MLKRNNRN